MLPIRNGCSDRGPFCDFRVPALGSGLARTSAVRRTDGEAPGKHDEIDHIRKQSTESRGRDVVRRARYRNKKEAAILVAGPPTSAGPTTGAARATCSTARATCRTAGTRLAGSASSRARGAAGIAR